MHKERRKFKRYAVDTMGIQALILPGADFYPVRDIGKGGAAIEYAPLPGVTLQSQEINIISIRCGPSCLKRISCRTAYDIETLMEGQSFTGQSRRILGLAFPALTEAQQAQLESLIEECFERAPNKTGDRGDDAEM